MCQEWHVIKKDVRQDIGYREWGLIAIAPSPVAPFNPMTYAPTFGSFGSYHFFYPIITELQKFYCNFAYGDSLRYNDYVCWFRALRQLVGAKSLVCTMSLFYFDWKGGTR